MPRLSLVWRPLVVPGALCAYVAALGFLPFLMFAQHYGSLRAFKSAYDEDTYLLDDTSTPYRFFSDAAVHVVGFFTPGVTGLLVAADIVIPIVVVIAAWLLVTQVVQDTALRILCVLLLLFGQELFSLANAIVWPGIHAGLRELAPPTTLTLFPDATTSYFSLFRTPEPAVSWVLLFGFLALLSSRDPVAAFEGKQRLLSYPILALLGFAYPFSAIPIALITAVIFAWSFLHDRSRTRSIGVSLLVAAASYVLAILISAIGDATSGTSVVFSSRSPVLTPAVVAGTVIVVSFLVAHRGATLRRPDLLIPFTAALFPVAVTNQQIVTGIMISARDWERYTNYSLVVFSVICLTASLKHRQNDTGSKQPVRFLRLGTWIAVVCLCVLLIGWQRDVYRAWAASNTEAHTIADLLNGLSGRVTEHPVVLESAALVPLVRLLTDDQHNYVLDYTRLFEGPVSSFAAGAPTDQAGPRRNELFAYAFRLGWKPARLEQQIRDELDGEAGGFYSHFVFALKDVWPPVTDNRRLRINEALKRLPSVTAAYAQYLDAQHDRDPGAVLVVAGRLPPAAEDGRTNELVASAPPSPETNLQLGVYVQEPKR